MKNPTPLQTIRKKCVDCCCGSTIQVKACPVLDCPLWLWRLGKHPFHKNNEKNPLLDPSFFRGNENLRAEQMLKLIKTKTGEQ